MTEYIIIVAMAQNRVIGTNGQMPWHLPSDLRHFKKTTMSHPLIMGRKTFDSIGKPLPGRKNIVLSRSSSLTFQGCCHVTTLTDALNLCANAPKAFIIGGGEIFRLAMPVVNTIIVTELNRAVEGDVLFPDIDADIFVKSEVHHINEEEPYQIVTYRRR